MKKFVYIIFLLSLFSLTACNTTAGLIKGVGEDVKGGTDTVSNWIKPAHNSKD